jgi:hypothetical protein
LSATVCSRCAEPLVDSSRGCGFCRGERRHEAVTKLTAAVASGSGAAMVARVEAIDTLRSLGHFPEQVLHARAQALDGCSAEEILEGLRGDPVGLEAVA